MCLKLTIPQLKPTKVAETGHFVANVSWDITQIAHLRCLSERPQWLIHAAVRSTGCAVC